MSETLPHPKKPASLLGVELAQAARSVILVIGGIKGGIGKSTTAMFLAYVWSTQGLKVLVLDADPKSGTARKWARRVRERGESLPFTVYAHPSEDLAERIEDEGWHTQFDIIICDTGGDNDRILQAAYRIADRLLLTSSPSPVDIDTLADTARTAVGGNGGERDIPVSVLLVNAKSDRMVKAAKTALRAVDLSVLTQTIGNRVAYQDSYGWGIDGGLDYVAVQYELDNS